MKSWALTRSTSHYPTCVCWTWPARSGCGSCSEGDIGRHRGAGNGSTASDDRGPTPTWTARCARSGAVEPPLDHELEPGQQVEVRHSRLRARWIHGARVGDRCHYHALGNTRIFARMYPTLEEIAAILDDSVSRSPCHRTWQRRSTTRRTHPPRPTSCATCARPAPRVLLRRAG